MSEAKPSGHGRPEADRSHQDAGQDAPRRYSEGMKVRREVLGDDHVDRAVANTTPFTEPFQDFITRYAWGEVWARPGLDRKTRSCITLAALVSLRAENEIAMHVRAALRNGLTPEEIGEVILHTALYAGLPAANAAFAIAQETLEATGHRPQATENDSA
jgi:4-carboxymuconolactone decarboxylase